MFGAMTVWVALVLTLLAVPGRGVAATAPTHIRVLYPSFAGSWAPAWVTKEAGFFANEGLDLNLFASAVALEWLRPCSAAARPSSKPGPRPH